MDEDQREAAAEKVVTVEESKTSNVVALLSGFYAIERSYEGQFSKRSRKLKR